MMDELQLLADLYKSADRQGPGGDAETEKVIAVAGPNNLTVCLHG